MKIRFSKAFTVKIPSVREGVLVLTGVNNSSDPDVSFQHLCEVLDQTRKEFNNSSLRESEEIKQLVEAFQTLGFDPEESKPSQISLISRVLERVDLPNINPIVNVINAMQHVHKVPIGAHALAPIEGDITIGPNESGLEFSPRESEGNEKVETSEVVHADEKSILTRKWCWRQGRKDLCNESTSDLIVFINSLDPKQDIQAIAEEIFATLKATTESPDLKAKFGILSGTELELDTNSLPELSTKKTINLHFHKVLKDDKIINRILNKAVEEILPSKDALEKLLRSGRRLRLYQGFDPTAPTLHIGHTVTMRKLEDFRKLGHEVIFLIGDFTARIGDPKRKASERQFLTEERVQENLKLYREQASRIIDIDNRENPIQVVFNSHWLSKLNFEDLLQLTSKFTVQQMIKRDLFQRRLQEELPLYLHEFMYPLMQGYDSVYMNVDLELGGNDQLFNMLAGRHLCAELLNKEKFVLAGKLLATADGKKMGKSEGNMIMLSDSAENIFGKVMAFTDEQILPGFELLTSTDLDELDAIAAELKAGTNPMELKKRLALVLTTELKGAQEATKAQKYFEEVFQNKSLEAEIAEVAITLGEKTITDLLVEAALVSSKSQARRLVEQGAVQIDGEKVADFQAKVDCKSGMVVKAGKVVVKIQHNV